MKNFYNLGILGVGAFSSFVLCDSLIGEHVNLSSLALCFISILSLVVVHFIIKMRNAREREEEWHRRFLDYLARLRREEEQRQRARAILSEEANKQEVKKKNPLMEKAKKKKKEEQCTEELIF